MDKLLLSLSLIAASVLTSMTVNSAPMQTSKLLSSIDPLQKRYNYFLNDNGGDLTASASTVVVDESQQVIEQKQENFDEGSTSSSPAPSFALSKDDIPDNSGSSSNDLTDKMTKNARLRQNKMIGFYPTAAVNPYHPFGYSYMPPPAVYYPPEFYDDFNTFFDNFGGEDDEIMSRQNPGNRRRPIYKNSPIYYIRLPPQPYMFIPGLG